MLRIARLVAIACAIRCGQLLVGGVAAAHSELSEATPGAGATVDALEEIVLGFDDPIVDDAELDPAAASSAGAVPGNDHGGLGGIWFALAGAAAIAMTAVLWPRSRRKTI